MTWRISPSLSSCTRSSGARCDTRSDDRTPGGRNEPRLDLIGSATLDTKWGNLGLLADVSGSPTALSAALRQGADRLDGRPSNTPPSSILGRGDLDEWECSRSILAGALSGRS